MLNNSLSRVKVKAVLDAQIKENNTSIFSVSKREKGQNNMLLLCNSRLFVYNEPFMCRKYAVGLAMVSKNAASKNRKTFMSTTAKSTNDVNKGIIIAPAKGLSKK